MIYRFDPFTPQMNPILVVDCSDELWNRQTRANTTIMVANATSSVPGMVIANTGWTSNTVAIHVNAGTPNGNYIINLTFVDSGSQTYGPYALTGTVKSTLP